MYVNFNENPRGNYYAGDCVIRAISAVMNEPWEKIYTELCAEGYDMGDWGNSNAVWDSYLRRRGFKRYVCSNDCPSCYSLANFAEDHPSGRYVVGTGSHAIAVIDGDYWDAFDSGSVIPILYYTKEGE